MPRRNLDPITAANRLIWQLLVSLANQAPQVALASFSLINADAYQPDSIRPYYRATTQHPVPRRLQTLDARMPSVPDWARLLPPLRAGRCPLLRMAGLPINPVPEQRQVLGAARSLVCPATDPQGELVGAVFLTLREHDVLPRGNERRDLMSAAKRAGGHIAAIIALCGAGTIPTQAEAAA